MTQAMLGLLAIVILGAVGFAEAVLWIVSYTGI
jgi:hypothetical protein